MFEHVIVEPCYPITGVVTLRALEDLLLGRALHLVLGPQMALQRRFVRCDVLTVLALQCFVMPCNVSVQLPFITVRGAAHFANVGAYALMNLADVSLQTPANKLIKKL
jgi:hypothetical protein